MQKISANLAVLEHELTEIRMALERQTGVLIGASDATLTEAILSHLESRRMSSAADLISVLQSSETECESLVETLLDGTTGFFRHAPAFEALARVAIPDLGRQKVLESPRPLRIWSAGCSTGQEAYSIAISVCEAVNCVDGVWKVQIVGSDIRRRALQTAERGLYPEQELQAMPRHLLHQYFAKVGEHYLIKPRVRNLVAFAPTNLAQPHYIGRFDCIFCMDVLPHFSKHQRTALVQRLHLYLQLGGFLFLGPGEKLPAGDTAFVIHGGPGYSIYQRPLATAAVAGR